MPKKSIVFWLPLFVVISVLAGGCTRLRDAETTEIPRPTATPMDTAPADRPGSSPSADMRTTVPTSTMSISGNSATDPATHLQKPDVWNTVRTTIPEAIPIYKPTLMPEYFYFEPPVLLEARVDAQGVSQYTVLYSSSNESLVFILNTGKGAYGNFPPPDDRAPIMVLGTHGELMTATETQTVGVFWQNAGQHYQIKAYAMMPDELQAIVESLVLVEY